MGEGDATSDTLLAPRHERGETNRPAPLPPTPSRKGRGSLVHLPFGQTNASALEGLAGLLKDALLRTTPWRAFHHEIPLDPAALAALGFVTDPADPRLRIAACPGAPACASGTVPARADAALLAKLGLANLHVSGCAKGCAHHAPAATLVGRDGRYDLIRHGRAGDPPDAVGLTLAQAAELLA
jgi:precorrin-3B synthase